MADYVSTSSSLPLACPVKNSSFSVSQLNLSLYIWFKRGQGTIIYTYFSQCEDANCSLYWDSDQSSDICAVLTVDAVATGDVNITYPACALG